MSDATSILDLPTDPVGGGTVNGNVVMTAHEQPSIPTTMPSASDKPSAGALDPNTISQFVSGLQQAIMTGATALPSRDIPMNTTNVNADPQVQPNYVPPPPPNTVDYIRQYEQSTADMIDQYNQKKRVSNSLDDMYNEVQTPLLLAVLYFLFQLPFFKKFLYTYIPFLFSNDGNYNIQGFVFISVMFGALFHFLMKTTSYFGTF